MDALTTVIVVAALAGVPVVVTVAGTVRGGVESRLSLRVPEITEEDFLDGPSLKIPSSSMGLIFAGAVFSMIP